MQFNKNYIFIVFILGILLLYSYYYYIQKNPKFMELWGKIKPPFIYVYYISMLLSAIGFLLFFYYLFLSNSFNSEQINKLFIALILILVISMFWMPLSFNYLKNKNNLNKILVLITLFLVALSILYLLYVLYNVNETKYKFNKELGFYGMLYFFIHCFFLDFITWSYNFF